MFVAGVLLKRLGMVLEPAMASRDGCDPANSGRAGAGSACSA